LRDDEMSYVNYVKQMTYLLFHKIADELSRPLYNQPSPIPAKYAWTALVVKDGHELFDFCRRALELPGNKMGTLELIFGKSPTLAKGAA
jgi:type I restriction enzyme M protein